ncbi:MAG TPA: hypothetical protein VM144_04255 [Aestuariivirga sp.]|nr:hypothetical protein [Aestuariivirga sp.]
MTINRRNFITLMGAAATAVPTSLPPYARATAVAYPTKKWAIITIVDRAIPNLRIYAQFDVFRSHNKALGLPFDEHMCFGFTAGDGTRFDATACAKICNGWIANMRRHGIEKIAVLVWSRRLGLALITPLLIIADVKVVRLSGHPRKFVAAFLRAANKKPNGRRRTRLECCDATGEHAYHLLIDHGFKPLLPDELLGLRE